MVEGYIYSFILFLVNNKFKYAIFTEDNRDATQVLTQLIYLATFEDYFVK